MTLPVSKKEFWRGRLRDAAERGHLHYSIYLCPDKLWQEIEATHRAILKRETDYPGVKVLDAGCGYGRFADMFENYVGVDISPDLLRVARARKPLKTFIEGDLSKLRFKDKAFDIAFCVSMKGMIVANLGQEAWEPIEKELQRVAKRVILLEYEEAEVYTIV